MQIPSFLCLHTLRADCNTLVQGEANAHTLFASTRSVQIATVNSKEMKAFVELCLHTLRADCNRVDVADVQNQELCLHTLRADCNHRLFLFTECLFALPPHAPCRLQRGAGHADGQVLLLCLHTLRADCN